MLVSFALAAVSSILVFVATRIHRRGWYIIHGNVGGEPADSLGPTTIRRSRDKVEFHVVFVVALGLGLLLLIPLFYHLPPILALPIALAACGIGAAWGSTGQIKKPPVHAGTPEQAGVRAAITLATSGLDDAVSALCEETGVSPDQARAILQKAREGSAL